MLTLKVISEGSPVESVDVFLDNLRDFTPVWPECHEIINRHSGQWLGTSGEGTYDPLAVATLRRPRRTARPFDTNPRALWGSVSQKDAPNHIFEYDATSLRVGTDNPIGHWHMKRRTRPGTRWVLPARPLLRVTDELVGLLSAAISAFITGRDRVKGYQKKGVSRYG